jgi:hypothetical protein
VKEVFKKYCSIIFLFLFLFPLVEKEMHALEHADDVHCSASDKHFHELEHSCSICDYSVPDSNEPAQELFSFVAPIIHFTYISQNEDDLASSRFYYLPSRAPPII